MDMSEAIREKRKPRERWERAGPRVGVGVLVIAPLIKRLMHLDTLGTDAIPGNAEIGETQAPGMHPDPRSSV